MPFKKKSLNWVKAGVEWIRTEERTRNRIRNEQWAIDILAIFSCGVPQCAIWILQCHDNCLAVGIIFTLHDPVLSRLGDGLCVKYMYLIKISLWYKLKAGITLTLPWYFIYLRMSHQSCLIIVVSLQKIVHQCKWASK